MELGHPQVLSISEVGPGGCGFAEDDEDDEDGHTLIAAGSRLAFSAEFGQLVSLRKSQPPPLRLAKFTTRLLPTLLHLLRVRGRFTGVAIGQTL